MCVDSGGTSPCLTCTSSMPSLNELSHSPDNQQVIADLDRVVESSSPKEVTERNHNNSKSNHSRHASETKCIVLPENHVGSVHNKEKVQFCVADVRKRLDDHLYMPKKMFSRDPEDPSGE